MNIELYKINRDTWLVKPNEKEVHQFKNIEEASDYMEELGLVNEEIDNALIALAVERTHTRAYFDSDRKFLGTDDKKPGVA